MWGPQIKRNLDARKREKQEEQRAKDRIRAKLGACSNPTFLFCCTCLLLVPSANHPVPCKHHGQRVQRSGLHPCCIKYERAAHGVLHSVGADSQSTIPDLVLKTEKPACADEDKRARRRARGLPEELTEEEKAAAAEQATPPLPRSAQV